MKRVVMLTARIEQVEPKPKPPKTLAGVEPFVLCKVCPTSHSCVESRAWKDSFDNVWILRSNGVPHCLDWKPCEYPVLEVIGPLIFPTDGVEVKVEPPKPRTLNQLGPWEFAVVKFRSITMQGPVCHGGDNHVYRLADKFLKLVNGIIPSEYTVVGESLGRLEIEDKEEEPDDD